MEEFLIAGLCLLVLVFVPILTSKLSTKKKIYVKVIAVILLAAMLIFSGPTQRWWTYIIFAIVICQALWDIYKLAQDSKK